MLWCLYFATFHDCVYSTLWIYHNWFNSWTFWFLPFCDNTNNIPLHILMFVFCAHKDPFLHGIYLGVESLDHRVCVSLSLIEAVTLCSKTCVPVSCHWRVYIATQPCHHLLLLVYSSASLVVVVVSISLWLTNEVENFFKCLVTIWILSAMSSGLMFCFVLS